MTPSSESRSLHSRHPTRRILGPLLVLFVATGSVHAAAPAAKADNSDAGAIWAEWGVAAVLAGIDSDSGMEVRNKLYFVVHGPSYEKVVPAIGEVAGDCALKVAKALGNDLTSRAGELIPETAADETDAQFAARIFPDKLVDWICGSLNPNGWLEY